MATRMPARPVRSVPSRSVRSVPRRRSHPLRRLAITLILVALAAIGAYLYALRVYAPGLKAEAAMIPAIVRNQLAAHNAPYTPLAAISPDLPNAIVSIEDRRFYVHPGVDPIGLIRAALVNTEAKRVDQGGSTLEEQLAKRALVHDDRSWHAKLRTLALAWAIDQDFSKRYALELYLNDAYYGRGAYGAEAAAQVYFGTDAGHLTLGEAAFLAAMPQAPSIYGSHPTSSAVIYRWHTVLRDMATNGYATWAQVRAAEASPLPFVFQP
ncbi:MAG TPA: biosynthetic peptidoglycan transglycosylase [Chloroflexota bacterium]|nr:biosynthetic peptidoglycan transglycosylase [Chloroflexota bacterium]